MVGVVQKYPALTFLSALGPVLVAVIGFFVNDGHLTVTQGAWVTTVVVGLVSLYTAFRTDNLSISLLTGFATTFLTGLVTFGVHVSPDIVSFAVAVITFLAGHLLHIKVSPKQGKVLAG